MNRALRLAGAITLAFSCSTLAASAGATTGTIEGRVFDPRGLPMPNARVSLEWIPSPNGDRVSISANSDERGYFHFLSVYPDQYELKIFMRGYFVYETKPFEAHADQITTCNAQMVNQAPNYRPALALRYPRRPLLVLSRSPNITTS